MTIPINSRDLAIIRRWLFATIQVYLFYWYETIVKHCNFQIAYKLINFTDQNIKVIFIVWFWQKAQTVLKYAVEKAKLVYPKWSLDDHVAWPVPIVARGSGSVSGIGRIVTEIEIEIHRQPCYVRQTTSPILAGVTLSRMPVLLALFLKHGTRAPVTLTTRLPFISVS